jgi:hypothetical protein
MTSKTRNGSGNAMTRNSRGITNSRMPKPKLFCSECGARAQATCDCGASYIPARVYAERAIAAHPERSNRAIAEETGISHETIRQVREATGNNLAVRIGRDGKLRRVPRHLIPGKRDLTPEELVQTPAAKQLLEEIDQTLKALRKEGAIRAMSPNTVGKLVYDLLTRVFQSKVANLQKAKACGDCASEWKIDETKLTEDVIDSVRKTAQAWSDLLEKLEAAADSSSGVADVAPCGPAVVATATTHQIVKAAIGES